MAHTIDGQSVQVPSAVKISTVLRYFDGHPTSLQQESRKFEDMTPEDHAEFARVVRTRVAEHFAAIASFDQGGNQGPAHSAQ